MGIFNEPIDNTVRRLQNWLLVNSGGGHVLNLPLDLINRANQWLQTYRQWDMLIKIVPLNVGQGGSIALPSDLKSILDVYSDMVVPGIPYQHFYEDNPDPSFRYTKLYTYDKANGHSFWTLTFPSVSPLLFSPKLKYVAVLPDFVGTKDDNGNYTECSFFSPGLLLRTAQKLHSEEKGLAGDNVQTILQSFKEELAMFETAAQFNNQQPDLTPKNKFGQPFKIANITMRGGSGRTGYSPYTPAQQAGFHGY